jgi:hypothetical protein
MNPADPRIAESPQLARELKVKDATVHNKIDMIGVGPVLSIIHN